MVIKNNQPPSNGSRPKMLPKINARLRVSKNSYNQIPLNLSSNIAAIYFYREQPCHSDKSLWTNQMMLSVFGMTSKYLELKILLWPTANVPFYNLIESL